MSWTVTGLLAEGLGIKLFIHLLYFLFRVTRMKLWFVEYIGVVACRSCKTRKRGKKILSCIPCEHLFPSLVSHEISSFIVQEADVHRVFFIQILFFPSPFSLEDGACLKSLPWKSLIRAVAKTHWDNFLSVLFQIPDILKNMLVNTWGDKALKLWNRWQLLYFRIKSF